MNKTLYDKESARRLIDLLFEHGVHFELVVAEDWESYQSQTKYTFIINSERLLDALVSDKI